MKKIIFLLAILCNFFTSAQNVLRISGNTDRQQLDSLYLNGSELRIKIQNSVEKGVDLSGLVQTSLPEYGAQVVGTATTAVKGKLYVMVSGTTLTLPVSPTEGDWVEVSNLSDTSVPVIARNGSNIMGAAENLNMDRLNIGFKLVYVNTTLGWVIIGQ